jgi:hypothetical protein
VCADVRIHGVLEGKQTRLGHRDEISPTLLPTHGAIAQTPMPQTPTTKILAVGTFAPGTDMSQVQRILPTEARETVQLYLDGKIDQWYSLEDRPGVVFILNMTDTQAAHAMLEELPLGKAHLMTFQLTPIGPLNPLRQLLVPAVPH